MIEPIHNRGEKNGRVYVTEVQNHNLVAKINEVIAALNSHTHEANLRFDIDMDTDFVVETREPNFKNADDMEATN